MALNAIKKIPLSKVVWVFLMIALVFPLLYPLGIVVQVNEMVQEAYDAVETIPPDSLAILVFSKGPGTMPEIRPQLQAFIYHLSMNGVKWMLYGNTPENLAVNEMIIQEMKPELDAMGYEIGVDYLHLGFLPGETAIIAMATDPWSVINKDSRGVLIEDIPIMQRFKTGWEDVDLLVINGGTEIVAPAVTYWGEPHGTTIIMTSQAASYTGIIAFYETGQVDGYVGNIRATAEYESLIKRPSYASAQMDAQSLGHIVVLAGLIIGNISYFVTKGRKPEEEKLGEVM